MDVLKKVNHMSTLGGVGDVVTIWDLLALCGIGLALYTHMI